MWLSKEINTDGAAVLSMQHRNLVDILRMPPLLQDMLRPRYMHISNIIDRKVLLGVPACSENSVAAHKGPALLIAHAPPCCC